MVFTPSQFLSVNKKVLNHNWIIYEIVIQLVMILLLANIVWMLYRYSVKIFGSKWIMYIYKFGRKSWVLWNTANATHFHYIFFTFSAIWTHQSFLTRAQSIRVTCFTIWRTEKGTVFTVITFRASWNNQNLLLLFIINNWIDQCKKYQNIKEICLTFVTVCSNISIYTTVKAYSTKRVAGCIIFAIIITSFTAVYSKKSIWAFYNL